MVGIRELQRDASGVVGRVVRTGRPTVVTNRGAAVAVVVPVDPDALEDYVLATASTFVRSMREADRDLAEGRTRSAADVFAELDASAPAQAAQHDAPHLNDIQLELLHRLAEGRSLSAAGEELGINEATVHDLVENIFAKLKVSDRATAVRG